jgi:hypothetical protein
MKHLVAILLLLIGVAVAQKPVAELPRVYIDTTYSLPAGGTTWAAHTAAQLTTALSSSAPGDVIVLDAGTTYTGNFIYTAKSNPSSKWIYVISSALASLPAGTRVSPASVANMPKLLSINSTPAMDIQGGANYIRFAGIEVTESAPISNLLFGSFNFTTLLDHIYVDRCYLHGLTTASVHRGISAQASYFALIDSYVSDIQGAGVETQAVAMWQTPGPIKIVNNYLSATTENILFGGAGGATQPYITSDVEVRNNYLFKPLSWVGNPIAAVKNAFEVKNAQRLLFDSNTIENVWSNAQVGFAVVLTVRTDQSGDVAVVDDITVSNNVLKNVVSGFNHLAKDDGCKLPACHNAGESLRVVEYNNLITFYDPTILGGARNTTVQYASGTDYINGGVAGIPTDQVFQHNTSIANASKPCFLPLLIAIPTGASTQNIWVQDNAFCREIPGVAGQPLIGVQMLNPTTSPNDLAHRFSGNQMYRVPGDLLYTYPAGNSVSSTPYAYDPVTHIVTAPTYTATVGPPAPPFQAGWMGVVGTPTLLSITVAPATATIIAGGTQALTATGNYSDGSTQNFTSTAAWSSSNTAIATVNVSGLATGVAAGTATITATQGGVSGVATLTVGSGITLVSIAVTPSAPTITTGHTQQFVATGTYSDASTANITSTVTWASGTTAVATINATGLASGLTAGTTAITAALGGVTSPSDTLTVTAAVTVTSVAVTPANPSIHTGTQQQFVATATFSDASTLVVTNTSTWASGTPTVATVNTTGLATAVSVGSSTIGATYSGVTGSTTLTVTSPSPILVSIAVLPPSPTIPDPGTLQFTAIGTYNDASTQNLTSAATWASGTVGTATIASGGLATAVAPGTTAITATVGSIVSPADTATVSSPAPTLVSIALSPLNASIVPLSTLQYVATCKWSDSSTTNCTSTVRWLTANSGIATISTTGLAQAVGTGSTTIAASYGAVSGTSALSVLRVCTTWVTPHGIGLSWVPSLSAGITDQLVCRGTVPGGEICAPPLVTIANNTTGGFMDTSGSHGTLYYYIVEACHGSICSSSSDEASATFP